MHQQNWIARVLFIVAFVLAGAAILEKAANMGGYTLLRSTYQPSRLLELAAVVMLFVIAVLLRDLRRQMSSKA
jgi:hypothetical protein